MNAQCPICSDILDQHKDIACLPCGHTFHHECLIKWTSQSLTCPSCRIKLRRDRIISKLYFDVVEPDDISPDDAGQLKNQLSDAQLEIRMQKKAKTQLQEQQSKLFTEMDKMREEKSELEQLHRQSLAENTTIRTQLKQYKYMETERDQSKDEARKLRRKLEDLQSVDNLVKGLSTDIEETLGSYKDLKQLATWHAVVKKELDTKKLQVRKLRTDVEKLKRELDLNKKALLSQSEALSINQEQLKHREDDLQASENEISSLKKKINSLQTALGSPSDTASSFAHRLIAESPAPDPKRPRLSDGPDLDITPDLFPECTAINTPDSVKAKRDLKEYGTQYIKFSTLSKATSQKKSDTKVVASAAELRDVSNMPGLSNFNLFKKKSGFIPEKTSIKKGYNGLGGHGKFLAPSGVAVGVAKKKPKQKPLSRASSSVMPSLPSMDKFIVLD